MTNPNYIPQWPLYKDKDGVYIRALPIKAIDYANDGSAQVEFDGAYSEQYISSAFIATFKPEVGGYLFNSQYGETLYLSKSDFEAKYTKDSEDGGSASVTSSSITDATETGKAVLTAKDRPAARAAINIDRVQQNDTETRIVSADGKAWFYTGSSGTGFFDQTSNKTTKFPGQGVAVTDPAGDTPTKAEFTALLASLRASGAIAS